MEVPDELGGDEAVHDLRDAHLSDRQTGVRSLHLSSVAEGFVRYHRRAA